MTDSLPQIGKTVTEICKLEVEKEKVQELDPDYLKNLRKELDVQITDAELKSLDDSVRAQAQAEMPAAAAPDAAAKTNSASPTK
jgi:hypothetical protein